MNNYMKLEIPAKSTNEAFVRATVGAFISQIDPTIEELSDIKTAVSEGVTNAIIHGYETMGGVINIICRIEESIIEIVIIDFGVGISNIEKAREPLYTSKPDEERSGMGFTVMETFMDTLIIESKAGEGTRLTMRKKIERK
ncbi:MAG: anti-sigma F factor [Ruminococcaceae bacterium]|nr:anti-sigma F factor [Oscillospiraceae bacterium]